MSPKQKRKARRDDIRYKDPNALELLKQKPVLYKLPKVREFMFEQALYSKRIGEWLAKLSKVKGIDHETAEEIALTNWV